MKKVAVVLLFVAVLALAVPAAASQPIDVDFEIDSVPGAAGISCTFTAEGPAVNDGVICASGDVQELARKVRFPKRGEVLHVHLRREFICDDGGSFIMNHTHQIQDPVGPDREVSGRWNIISGTDGYENLHGSGLMTNLIFVRPNALEFLSGKLANK